MLALTTQEGDAVVRSDENKSYIKNSGSAGTMADFTLLSTPTDAVLSVNGSTGAVVLTHDGFSDFVANEHIDWTGASAGTIDPSNYADTDTTYDVMGSGNSYAAGLVLAGHATHAGSFLRKDGTWAVPPDTGGMTEAGAAGFVCPTGACTSFCSTISCSTTCIETPFVCTTNVGVGNTCLLYTSPSPRD